jgi:hypothetical protein
VLFLQALLLQFPLARANLKVKAAVWIHVPN